MNKKAKILSLLLALIMALSCFGICAFAAGESYLTLNYNGESFVVSKCITSASGEVNIPATHTANGITAPVTAIGANAFKDAERISKVTIPASVTSIGASAFENCALLGTIVFEGDECTIGTAAFRYCSTLKTINLPANLKSIPLEAFANCSALNKIDIPLSVTAIGKEAFRNCYSLTGVNIPANVNSIGVNAFLNCASVKAYGVAAGNTAYKAISDCLYDYSGETLIQYPNGKTATSFTVPAGTKKIADSAFGSNATLAKITLPSGLETVTAYAFNQCTALSEIDIPASVTYIGPQAFGSCKKLKEITIPAKVAAFSGAFYNSGIETVVIENGVKLIDEKAFERCASLKSVTIPESVTEIAMGAFDGCSSLETLKIPESVRTIGNNAFIGCSSLTLQVKKNSAAHTYALEKNIPYELYGEEPVKTIVSIAVKTLPSKTSYTAGDKISTSGMVLTVNYSDGTSTTVTSGYEVDTQYAIGSGTKTVTVTYKGKTATFVITVVPAAEKKVVGMRIQKLPDKMNYYYKESLSTSGMTLFVEYSDGSSGTVTTGYTVPATQFTKTGTHTVTVTYQGFTDDFSVSVTYAWWQMLIRILLLGFLWY